MTGTADTEAAEFEKIYNLGVTVIQLIDLLREMILMMSFINQCKQNTRQ